MTVETRLTRDLNQFAKECAALFRQELEKASKTCISCTFFDETKEQCKLNGLRPPARIIAYGCEYHDEPIPF